MDQLQKGENSVKNQHTKTTGSETHPEQTKECFSFACCFVFCRASIPRILNHVFWNGGGNGSGNGGGNGGGNGASARAGGRAGERVYYEFRKMLRLSDG